MRHHNRAIHLLVLATMTLGSLAALPHPAAAEPGLRRAPAELCAMLDDPAKRPYMDGLLFPLLRACGRDHELGMVRQSPNEVVTESVASGADVPVNDPAGEEIVTSHTQSETSIARNGASGTLCVGYNDSFHEFSAGEGFTGFSRSADDGASFTDQGALGAGSSGDPAVVWRQLDNAFYFAALKVLGYSVGVGLWKSSDDCQTFQPAGVISAGASDDKELMAVDNHATTSGGGSNPYYGNLYVSWTDYDVGGDIRVATSNDGGTTWFNPITVGSAADGAVQGSWPAVGPDGELYVAWVKFKAGNTIDVEIVKSTDGGASFSAMTRPVIGAVEPRDAAASTSCGRAALNGNIRYLPSPQLAVGDDGVVHVVYSVDPDGAGSDTVDVFYRRSVDGTASWQPAVLVNDDGTTTDQFFPSLSVGPTNAVSVAWYDRRNDTADNLLIDSYSRLSLDGGATWQPSQRMTDVATPVYLDPDLATCYHGDYDSQVQTDTAAVAIWADDRNLQGGHNDPDVFSDVSPLSDDFLLLPTPRAARVCAPDDANYAIDVPQFEGFVEQVVLTVADLPSGLSAQFDPSQVTPPAASSLVISGTGAVAAGSYGFSAVGTATSATHETGLELTVFDGPPLAPVLTSPAAGATDVEPTPLLTWSADPQATEYEYQVATDAGFLTIVAAGTSPVSEARVSPSLAPETSYWWHTRAVNPCGDGPWATAASFTTRATPPILLVDDDDNFPDVRASYATTLPTIGETFDVWDTSAGSEPDADDLAPYSIVIWFSGDKFGGSAGDAGPDDAAETALAGWLDGGGCLLLSSQDYYWDNLQVVTPLMADYLGVAAVGNDATTTTVAGAAGSAFAGLGPFTLSYPFSDLSDELTPDGSAAAAFEGAGGTVGLSKAAEAYFTAYLGFPFEALPDAAAREAVMSALLTACRAVIANPAIFADGFESGDTVQWSAAVP